MRWIRNCKRKALDQRKSIASCDEKQDKPCELFMHWMALTGHVISMLTVATLIPAMEFIRQGDQSHRPRPRILGAKRETGKQ